jgi:hypothetical protein
MAKLTEVALREDAAPKKGGDPGLDVPDGRVEMVPVAVVFLLAEVEVEVIVGDDEEDDPGGEDLLVEVEVEVEVGIVAGGMTVG